MNKALRQVRISDIDFVVDSSLKVISATRNFYRFFNEPDEHVSLTKYVSPQEAEKISAFLSSIKSNHEEFGVYRFVVRENPVNCVFFAEKQGDNFSIHLMELNYCRETFEDLTRQVTELSAVCKTVDIVYCVWDGKQFTLKNTKSNEKLFEGNAEDCVDFFFNQRISGIYNQENLVIGKQICADMEKGIGDKNYTLRSADGSNIVVHTTSGNGVVIAIVISGVKIEVSEKAFIDEKDGLTGLLNRKTVIEAARESIERNRKPCTLLILDIDKFKDYNDTFGHDYGDKVLVSTAEVIRNSVKGFGVAGRIGGDEFMCVLDTVSEEDLRTITRNIKLGIQWSISAESTSDVVTCSMGCARYPDNGTTYEELFKLADKCLYIAKNKGRNCYVIYKPEIHDKVIVSNENQAKKMLSGEFFKSEALQQQIILKSFINEKPDIADITSQIHQYMNASCVILYDENNRPVYKAGDFKEDVRADFFEQDYFKYYNEMGYLHADNVNVFDTLSKKVFDMYLKINIASTLEIKLVNKEGIYKGLLCIDVYKPARTFPKEKVVFALLCAQEISDRL